MYICFIRLYGQKLISISSFPLYISTAIRLRWALGKSRSVVPPAPSFSIYFLTHLTGLYGDCLTGPSIYISDDIQFREKIKTCIMKEKMIIEKISSCERFFHMKNSFGPKQNEIIIIYLISRAFAMETSSLSLELMNKIMW